MQEPSTQDIEGKLAMPQLQPVLRTFAAGACPSWTFGQGRSGA